MMENKEIKSETADFEEYTEELVLIGVYIPFKRQDHIYSRICKAQKLLIDKGVEFGFSPSRNNDRKGLLKGYISIFCRSRSGS